MIKPIEGQMSLWDRPPNTQYVLSLSYGKDSLACLAAIES